MKHINHPPKHGKPITQPKSGEKRKQLLHSMKTLSTRRGIAKTLASMPHVSPTSSPIHPWRTKRAHSLSTNLQELSLLNTNPTFDDPQPSHPKSAQEQCLSQELALCDFRSYLLAKEVHNKERLVQVRSKEWIAYDVEEMGSPEEETELLRLREQEMAVQADELTRKRSELQRNLDGLTGRKYPLPKTYRQLETEAARSSSSNASSF